MIVYVGAGGTVTKNVFRGYSFYPVDLGYRVRPTPWMRAHMAQLSLELVRQGHIEHLANTRQPLSRAYWEHMLDLAGGPLNGLLHHAIASMPIAEVAANLVDEAGARER